MHPMYQISQSTFMVVKQSSLFLHIILYLKTDCNKNKCLGIGILALDVDFGLENADMDRETRGNCNDQVCDGQTKIKPPNWPSRRLL